MIDAVAGAASRRVITNKNGRGGERRTASAGAVFVKQRALEEVQTENGRLARIYINMCGFCGFIHRAPAVTLSLPLVDWSFAT